MSDNYHSTEFKKKALETTKDLANGLRANAANTAERIKMAREKSVEKYHADQARRDQQQAAAAQQNRVESLCAAMPLAFGTLKTVIDLNKAVLDVTPFPTPDQYTLGNGFNASQGAPVYAAKILPTQSEYGRVTIARFWKLLQDALDAFCMSGNFNRLYICGCTYENGFLVILFVWQLRPWPLCCWEGVNY